MPKANDKVIVVGSEMKPRGGSAQPYYRVIKVDPSGGNGHTTINLPDGGGHYTWGVGVPGYEFSDLLKLDSNPPAAVGDLVTNGHLVYKVTAYDVMTDKLTLTTIGERNPRNGKLMMGRDYIGSFDFTRLDWPSILTPFVEPVEVKPPAPPAWKPEIGKLAKIVSIADCCAATAAQLGIEVGDVRQVDRLNVSGPLGVHECYFQGIGTFIDCTLGEPGAPYMPRNGEEVIVTAITTGNGGTQSEHKVGDRVKVYAAPSLMTGTTKSGDAPGYIYLTDGPGYEGQYGRKRSWAIVKKAPEAKKAAPPVAAPFVAPFVPTAGQKVRVLAICPLDERPGCKVGDIKEVRGDSWAPQKGDTHEGYACVYWVRETGGKSAGFAGFVKCELITELPKVGERIVVKKIAAWDTNPSCKVGDTIEVIYACTTGLRARPIDGGAAIVNHNAGCAAITEWEKAPAAVYVPKKGDRIKITKCFGGCGASKLKEGSYHIVETADLRTPASYSGGQACVLLWAKGVTSGGAYVLCEAAPAMPAAVEIGKVGEMTWDIRPMPYYSIDFARAEREMAQAMLSHNWIKPAPTQREKALTRLANASAQLGPNALDLLADVAERLVKGKEHGDFEVKMTPAQWTKEAYEEDLDALVYRTMRARSAA